jgi:hypothetical protein
MEADKISIFMGNSAAIVKAGLFINQQPWTSARMAVYLPAIAAVLINRLDRTA